jgi:hypothetical protein
MTELIVAVAIGSSLGIVAGVLAFYFIIFRRSHEFIADAPIKHLKKCKLVNFKSNESKVLLIPEPFAILGNVIRITDGEWEMVDIDEYE